jgi:hypothetical protein
MIVNGGRSTGVTGGACSLIRCPRVREGPAGADGQDGPPDAGNAKSILSRGTFGDASEKDLWDPRPDRLAVATNGSCGTEPKRTVPCGSVVPWWKRLRSFATPMQTAALGTGAPALVT